MSFNCIYMNDERIIIGSDSRESFDNHTYNDDYQKVFVNEDLKLIWSMTGLIKHNNIDYPTIINCTMNMLEASIEDKLDLIINIMKHSTYQQFNQLKKDSIFTLFVGLLNLKGELISYIIDIRNGEVFGHERFTEMEDPIVGGVHLEYAQYLDTKTMNNRDKAISNMTDLIIKVIKRDSKERYPSVGGNVCVVCLDKFGEITIAKNGELQ